MRFLALNLICFLQTIKAIFYNEFIPYNKYLEGLHRYNHCTGSCANQVNFQYTPYPFHGNPNPLFSEAHIADFTKRLMKDGYPYYNIRPQLNIIIQRYYKDEHMVEMLRWLGKNFQQFIQGLKNRYGFLNFYMYVEPEKIGECRYCQVLKERIDHSSEAIKWEIDFEDFKKVPDFLLNHPFITPGRQSTLSVPVTWCYDKQEFTIGFLGPKFTHLGSEVSITITDSPGYFTRNDEQCEYEYYWAAKYHVHYPANRLFYGTKENRDEFNFYNLQMYSYNRENDSVLLDLNKKTFHKDVIDKFTFATTNTSMRRYNLIVPARTPKGNQHSGLIYETTHGLRFMQTAILLDEKQCNYYHTLIRPRFIFMIPKTTSIQSVKMHSRDFTNDYFGQLYDLLKHVFPNSTVDVLMYSDLATICSDECHNRPSNDPKAQFVSGMQHINFKGSYMYNRKLSMNHELNVCYPDIIAKDAQPNDQPIIVVFTFDDVKFTQFPDEEDNNYVTFSCQAAGLKRFTNFVEKESIPADILAITTEKNKDFAEWVVSGLHYPAGIWGIPDKDRAKQLAKLPYMLHRYSCIDVHPQYVEKISKDVYNLTSTATRWIMNDRELPTRF